MSNRYMLYILYLTLQAVLHLQTLLRAQKTHHNTVSVGILNVSETADGKSELFVIKM